MKKIAVFGGNGFIGKAFVEQAKAKEFDVYTFGLPEVDIRKPETFAHKLKKIKPDVVINLAALLGDMLHAPSVKDMFEVNTMGNLNILYAAKESGVPVYIFASSITVHGENKIGDHRNRFSPFAPKHVYSASKAAAEYSLMQASKEFKGIKIFSVRPTMTIGKDTYMPHAPIEFVKTILNEKPIEIFGKGLHEREWIWVDDVAEGILKIIESGDKIKDAYNPFFLTGNRISMRDLANKVAKRLKGKVIYIPSTTQAFTLTSDPSDSKKMFGWSVRNNIDDMIEKIIAIHKNK